VIDMGDDGEISGQLDGHGECVVGWRDTKLLRKPAARGMDCTKPEEIQQKNMSGPHLGRTVFPETRSPLTLPGPASPPPLRGNGSVA
jgi:hypothetical protein